MSKETDQILLMRVDFLRVSVCCDIITEGIVFIYFRRGGKHIEMIELRSMDNTKQNGVVTRVDR